MSGIGPWPLMVAQTSIGFVIAIGLRAFLAGRDFDAADAPPPRPKHLAAVSVGLISRRRMNSAEPKRVCVDRRGRGRGVRDIKR